MNISYRLRVILDGGNEKRGTSWFLREGPEDRQGLTPAADRAARLGGSGRPAYAYRTMLIEEGNSIRPEGRGWQTT
jgi:hypothetical protein